MLKDINYSLIALFAFSGRLLVTGAGVGDAIGLAALCGLYAFTLYLQHNTEAPVNDSVKADVEQLRNTVNGLKMAKVMGKL